MGKHAVCGNELTLTEMTVFSVKRLSRVMSLDIMPLYINAFGGSFKINIDVFPVSLIYNNCGQ